MKAFFFQNCSTNFRLQLSGISNVPQYFKGLEVKMHANKLKAISHVTTYSVTFRVNGRHLFKYYIVKKIN